MDDLVEIHSKDYVFVDLKSNSIYKTKNLANFCRQYDIKECELRNVVNGRSRCTKDMWWGVKLEDWKGEFPDIVKTLYHKSGKSINYIKLSEACEKTGCDKSNLSKVLRGKARQTKGWSCKKW